MNNQDLRVQRKKHSLLCSQICLKRNLLTISPFKIYRKANVRRSTFYRHFNDKYDLLNHIVGTLIEYFRTLHLPEIDPKASETIFNKFMKDIFTFH